MEYPNFLRAAEFEKLATENARQASVSCAYQCSRHYQVVGHEFAQGKKLLCKTLSSRDVEAGLAERLNDFSDEADVEGSNTW